MNDIALKTPSTAAAPLIAREYEWLSVTNSPLTGISDAEFEVLRALARVRPGLCEPSFGGVRLKNYCGIVSLGERTLEILPKLGIDRDSSEASRGHLLRWLVDSGAVPTHVRQHTSQAKTSSPLLDTFIEAFLESAGKVVSQGLLHRYKSMNEDLPALRGRISWPRQTGVLLGRRDRIACAYDEFSADVPHNQVLKCALKAVSRSHAGTSPRRAGSLLPHFEDVSDVDPERIRGTVSTRDRQSRRYETCLAWAWIVLDALSPSLRHGLHSAPGLLFDMNKVFEAIAARRIGADARAAGTHVSEQDTSHHLGTYGNHPIAQLRPDLVLRYEQKHVAVADAKWKRLEIDSRNVPIIDGHDVYQLLAYAAAFDLREVTLIYPMHDGIRTWRPGPVELRSHGGGKVTLSVLLIDLASDEYEIATSASWHASSKPLPTSSNRFAPAADS